MCQFMLVASTKASLQELSVFSIVTAEALLLLFFACNAVKHAEHRQKQKYDGHVQVSKGAQIVPIFVVTGLIAEVLPSFVVLCNWLNIAESEA